MERRTKRIFAWSSIFIGTLLLGFPLQAVVNDAMTTSQVIIGVLGFIIVINGIRFLQRIDDPWTPKSAKPKRKPKRKHR